MKFLPSQILFFLQNKTTQRNSLLLLKFFILLAAIITTFSILFHLIMLYEGRDYSWITGFYWTLTVMSTLGFGDITFASDLGLSFTMLVLLSGIVLLLIMLPFSFIQFFYAPWLEAQEKIRVPRKLAEGVAGHVILTNTDPITFNLISKLEKFDYNYVLLVEDMQQALELSDNGIKVVLGELDLMDTYERVNINEAALVVAANDDLTNTAIAFTIRELSQSVPIATVANTEHSRDILEFPGNTEVFEFRRELGQSLARRTLGLSHGANIIGNFEDLLIAEAPAMRTPLEGRTLAEATIRQQTGVNVVGVWERGVFELPQPGDRINSTSVLVLAGTARQLAAYERHFAISCVDYAEDAPVLILGGGRVGCATADSLAENNLPFMIVEKSAALVKRMAKQGIQGDAADINTLKRAGIETARAVIITTHDDAMNIYLTFYCRQLRPDVQIISRATGERNISKLHRAGADLVMSYASLGANAIFSLLQPNEVSLFAEGLNVFSREVNSSALQGRTLAEANIRQESGCNVIAIHPLGQELTSPDPQRPLRKGDILLLAGPMAAELEFDGKFSATK
ncbi:MAG: NAD-binding protein [Thermodesulfobacteriota bacterium]